VQCKKYFDRLLSNRVTLFFDERPVHFCSELCSLMHLFANRRLAKCIECNTEKYTLDLLKKKGHYFCSISCVQCYETRSQSQPCTKCRVACVPAMKLSTPTTEMLFCSFTCASPYQVGIYCMSFVRLFCSEIFIIILVVNVI